MLMFCKGRLLSYVVEQDIAAGQLQILQPTRSYCRIVPLR